MKKNNLFLTLTAALLLAPLTSTFAQSTWQTVDDFQYTPGKAAANRGVAASTSGAVFVAGSGADAAGTTHGWVHRSLDGGATWSTVLDVAPVNLLRVAASPTGDLLAVGTEVVANGRWLTYRSSDDGATWSLLDQFTFSRGKQATAQSAAGDAAGRIYVTGIAIDAQNIQHWTVRRSLDGGATWTTADDQKNGLAYGIAASPSGVLAVGYISGIWTVRRTLDGGGTWTTVDKYQLDSRYQSGAYALAVNGLGQLYVTGRAQKAVKKTTENHWITRTSSDGGATWRTVDDFKVNGLGYAFGITADVFGRIFAAGFTGNNPPLWVVRASPDAGATWVTTDAFSLAPAGMAQAAAVAADPYGNVFVAGFGMDSGSVNHALVRKLPAP
jgi:hypothetical protein